MKIVADITVFGEKYTTSEMDFESVIECAMYYSNNMVLENMVNFYQELKNGEFLLLAEDAAKSAVFRFRRVA